MSNKQSYSKTEESKKIEIILDNDIKEGIVSNELPSLIVDDDIVEDDISEDCAKDIVPDLCSTICRKESLGKCLDLINRTSTQSLRHKACVCVVCDCFIIGTEKFVG